MSLKGILLLSILGDSEQGPQAGQRSFPARLLAKCVLHYDTVTSVPNYLSNSTNVESEANNKVHLYVTDVFQGIILNLLNTHNNPEKKKLKITKWEDRDFDMLMGISSWCSFQHGQNHLLAYRPVPPRGESPRSSQAHQFTSTTFTGDIQHRMITEAYVVGPGIRITLKG